MHDAVVLGGGFYGCAIAIHLARQRRLRRVLVMESENALLTRASYHNQARVHNGYHYPRSFVTANRSRLNFPLFVRDWPSAVKGDFTKLYAVARRNSQVTARQFQRFCKEIGAPLEPAAADARALFDHSQIEAVFVAQEHVFDATALAQWARDELRAADVQVALGTKATEVCTAKTAGLKVTAVTGGVREEVQSRLVFNCTYSGLQQVRDGCDNTDIKLKHEIAEMALVQLRGELSRMGVTVMDGPFFSLMPFPPRQLHTLSHVRYTPHLYWQGAQGIDPYDRLRSYPRESRADRMVRDAARYMPAILDAKYVDSLFEVKTLSSRNESDDGRPILFEKHDALPGYYCVLGSKIDNIYDVLERLRPEKLDA